jgi:hypothetical protein
MSMFAPQFHGFRVLQIKDLTLSNDHGLGWATGLLRQYGPVVTMENSAAWVISAMQFANRPSILSEHDTMTHIEITLLRPALIVAIFIRAQHLRLSAAQYPCNFYVINCSSTGRSGRADYGIVRLSDSLQQYAVVIEAKRARVCRSNGHDLDGTGHKSFPILEYVQTWLARSGGYVSMDKSGSPSERTGAAFEWYDEAWQCKLQKFLFQVRSDWI